MYDKNKIISMPYYNLTKNDICNILDRYYNGISSKVLENEFNLKTGTLAYIRRKQPVELPRYINKKYSNEQLALAFNDYKNGMLFKDISKKYDISWPTLSRYMQNNNITFKNNHGRKNHFDEDFFKDINTEHKAYWLGFIYADGSISYSSRKCGLLSPNRLQINISNKDVCLLEQFCEDIGAKKTLISTYIPKGTYSTNPMSKIVLNSVKLCKNLMKHGVFPNKTGNLIEIPSTVPYNLIKHFIRGFFDGDGSAFINKTKKPFTTVEFVGDLPFLKNIQSFFEQNNIIHNAKIQKENRRMFPIYYLRYTKKECIKNIYHLFYDESTIFLKRKRDKFIF